jgi:predicted ATPase
MIKAWRLYNFKSVREDTRVELGPLTVLAGANSSGKSTVLQSMLMVAQTLESRVESRPVVLNGPLVRLGTFDDVRSYGSESDAILVGFELDDERDTTKVEFSFDVGGESSELAQLHPKLRSSEVWSRSKDGTNEQVVKVRRALEPPAERARKFGFASDGAEEVFAYEFGANGDLNHEGGVEWFSACFLEHFLPRRVLAVNDAERQRLELFRPLQEAFRGLGLVKTQARKIRYLGPLRDEPRALYPLSTTADTSDVGMRGEHTASVLDLHRQDLVSHVPAWCFPAPAPVDALVDFQVRTRTLEAVVVEWLKYLGVVESIEARDLGNLGHTLKVTTVGVTKPHDLTHVGTGVSQLLPIVVMCLLAPPDTALLIEQPELHLHPRVQTLLGDFFLAIAAMGRQVIVETHSEYLVNRLRYRIAASEGDRVASLVKTYFVEKDAKGASVFRPVVVNRYGAISEWPKGFFDQSQREIEHILLAGSRKKKAERSGGQ